jgi:DNA polymerase III delta subunit
VLSHGRTTAESADIYTVTAPNASVDAFALSNALLAGKSREALEALGVMKFERVEPTVVMGEISKTLSEMLGVKLLLADGKSAKEIAAAFKMHEYKAGLCIKAVSRVDVARLSRAVELAATADAALKQYATDYAPIERLICTL